MWKCYTIDATKIAFTNKKQLEGWITAWGRDSDYVKVNVFGEFPSASSLQLISTEIINEAKARTPQSFPHEPLIHALDVARFGDNKSVLVRRRGNDAKSLPRLQWRGLNVVDLANRVAVIYQSELPDALFVDEGGVGGGVVDVLRSLGVPVIGVNFGSKPGGRPAGSLVANKRAEMYVLLRDWLARSGAIENDLDSGEENNLAQQLIQIEYGFNARDEILLEDKESMRRRGIASPDDADALALTFAFPVIKRALTLARANECEMEYDVLENGSGPEKPRFTRYAEMMN
jgi:hypothetical protein